MGGFPLHPHHTVANFWPEMAEVSPSNCIPAVADWKLDNESEDVENCNMFKQVLVGASLNLRTANS